jgi:hypothetical protein
LLRKIEEMDISRSEPLSEIASGYMKLVNAYPSSVYAIQAYARILNRYGLIGNREEKMLNTMIALARHFPDEPQTIDIVARYTPGFIQHGRLMEVKKLAQELENRKVGLALKNVIDQYSSKQ